jgi:hypothetical protein
MTVETKFEHHPWELAWVVVHSTEEHLVSHASEVIIMNYMMLGVKMVQALKTSASRAGSVQPHGS